jgi:hypothetical protein
MNQELKNAHDALLRTGLCVVWITGVILAVTNLAAHEANSSETTFAIRASICALVTIVAITAHAYLVDKKVKEK